MAYSQKFEAHMGIDSVIAVWPVSPLARLNTLPEKRSWLVCRFFNPRYVGQFESDTKAALGLCHKDRLGTPWSTLYITIDTYQGYMKSVRPQEEEALEAFVKTGEVLDTLPELFRIHLKSFNWKGE